MLRNRPAPGRARQAGSSGAFPAGWVPPAHAALRRFDVDELLTRPGTYFNPETEIVLVVDDSADVDLELIEDEAEGAEWILLGDDAGRSTSTSATSWSRPSRPRGPALRAETPTRTSPTKRRPRADDEY